MVQYNKQVKALVDALAVEIMKGTLTQKRLNSLMAQLFKDLKVPTEQFLKRVEKMAYDEAWKEELSTVSRLMVLAKTNAIKSITQKEIKIISEYALTKDLIFTRWKNKEKNGFVSDVYNLEDAINNLPKYIRDNYRQRALAGMIAGDTPAQVASSLMDRNLNKKIRRNIKTLYETTKYKARSLANLAVLKQNEAYFDFYDFKTMEDERVETVCLRLEAEADKENWVTYDDVPIEAYTPVHFNCRCKIEPGFR